ncbi:hypothetical protein [Agrobacterium rosae]|uniref:hypothetical protein n=1 Tax=Agrobacterium rosae TaxID=1972867 RepID=UPI003A8119B7
MAEAHSSKVTPLTGAGNGSARTGNVSEAENKKDEQSNVIARMPPPPNLGVIFTANAIFKWQQQPWFVIDDEIIASHSLLLNVARLGPMR